MFRPGSRTARGHAILWIEVIHPTEAAQRVFVRPDNEQCQFKMARHATTQLELPGCNGWGGARPRTGPKRRPGAGPSHVRRAKHDPRWPVHVTLRAVRGLPSLRANAAARALLIALGRSCGTTFRVLHFSVQTDHVHMIVEADSSRALARGAQGLAGRCARALNRAWARRGPVWAHRYHARALQTPTELRHALSYLLLNFRKHLNAAPGVDPHSSGRWFDGWSHLTGAPTLPGVVSRPRTWLASVGWRRGGGPIDIREAPRKS